MKTLHLSIITILAIALTINVSVAVAQYGPGFYPPVHYPPTNDTKLELQVMNSTEFKERTAGYNYTLAGIDYNWIAKSNNYYDFGGARVTFLVWGFGNVTTKGEAFNLDSQMRIKSIFEYNADNPPAGYYTDRCMGGCPDMINKTKPQCCGPPYVPKTLDTPLKQFKSGIAAENVACTSSLTLVIKAEDGSPACVEPDTAQKLIERGWAEAITKTNNDTTQSDMSHFEKVPVMINGTISDYSFNCTIIGGQIEQANGDIVNKELILSIKSTENGVLVADIPRTLIDSKIDGQDSAFIVLEDKTEVLFNQTTTSQSRILNIPFQYGVSQIEIVAPVPIQ